MLIDVTNNLPVFLNKKLLQWQSSLGMRKTLKEYSEYLGVSAQILSMWMNGKRVPGPENIKQLAEKLGIEVYDALDIDRPDPLFTEIETWWDKLDNESKEKIHRIIQDAQPEAQRPKTNNPKTDPSGI